MGVIGYGDIGQASARLGRAHGMRIIALRRRTELSSEEQRQGLEVYYVYIYFFIYFFLYPIFFFMVMYFITMY